MKVYLNDDKTHVDPRPHNDILWGLKAHCGRFWEVSCKGGGEGINQKLFLAFPLSTIYVYISCGKKNMSHRFATTIFVTGLPKKLH